MDYVIKDRMADGRSRAADAGYLMTIVQQLLNDFQTDTVASAGNDIMFHAKLTRAMPLLFSIVS